MSRSIHLDNEGLPLCNSHTRWRSRDNTTTIEQDVNCKRCLRKLLFREAPTALRCSTCKQVKPVKEFARTRFHARGYSYNCKPCVKSVFTDPETVRLACQRWARRYPEKVRAERLARKAVPLKERCEICGSTERLHRHHPDYSKPLDVITVCQPCHEKVHHGYQ
jgi:hypothetical protein